MRQCTRRLGTKSASQGVDIIIINCYFLEIAVSRGHVPRAQHIGGAPSEGDHPPADRAPTLTVTLLPPLLTSCAIPALRRKVSWALVLINSSRVTGAARGGHRT